MWNEIRESKINRRMRKRMRREDGRKKNNNEERKSCKRRGEGKERRRNHVEKERGTKWGRRKLNGKGYEKGRENDRIMKSRNDWKKKGYEKRKYIKNF